MYHKLLTKRISKRNNKMDITNEILIETLQHVIFNYPFSTFPYITSHMNSTSATRQFNSGNCVGLCIVGQRYLKEKYGIVSYIIPASIPRMFQKPNYLHISHVGLFIPQDKTLGYILDFAFYFKEPIVVHFNNYTDTFYSKMQNLYNKTEENLKYMLKSYNKKQIYNKYQEMPKNTKYIHICYINDEPDCWNYYLREIINPDKSITNFYIHLNSNPFLCMTDSNYDLKLYIKFLDNETLLIKKYGENIFEGKADQIPFNIIEAIEPIINKYLKNDLLRYLTKVNPLENYCFKDARKTMKRGNGVLCNKRKSKKREKR